MTILESKEQLLKLPGTVRAVRAGKSFAIGDDNTRHADIAVNDHVHRVRTAWSNDRIPLVSDGWDMKIVQSAVHLEPVVALTCELENLPKKDQQARKEAIVYRRRETAKMIARTYNVPVVARMPYINRTERFFPNDVWK